MFWTHVKHLDLKFGPNLITQVLDSRNPRDHTNQVMYQTNLQLDLFHYVYDNALFSHFLVFNFIFTQFKAIRSCCFLLIDFAFVLGKNHVFEPIFMYLLFYDQFSYALEYLSVVARILCEERSNKQAAFILLFYN